MGRNEDTQINSSNTDVTNKVDNSASNTAATSTDEIQISPRIKLNQTRGGGRTNAL